MPTFDPALASAQLAPIQGLLTGLGERFNAAGFEISLVGGPVRDAFLGRLGQAPDLDFTTNARPEQILALLAGYAETTWDVGIRFGTVGARIAGQECEITTYRSEHYDPDSRKPEVNFGDSLLGDLGRRDFTINAMALQLPAMTLVDEYNGITDLAAGIIRTPNSPEISFTDDPLRMMRAARFAAQLDFDIEAQTLKAMVQMHERITIVSIERSQVEFMKIVMSDNPRLGLKLLVDTGLCDYIFPELPGMRLTTDEHLQHKDVYEHSLTVLDQAVMMETMHEPISGPDPVLRLSALFHDIGKPRTRKFDDGRVSFHHHEVVGARMTRKRMKEMRFSNDMIDDVSKLVELHLRFHGYGSGDWTDAAVRRYVRDAGPLLVRLHKLTRADCTTRNKKRAAALQHTYDMLEERIEALQAEEELNAIRPDLDGEAIMRLLDIPAGPEVGQAYRFLMELRLDRGPLDEEQATQALLAWWNARS